MEASGAEWQVPESYLREGGWKEEEEMKLGKYQPLNMWREWKDWCCLKCSLEVLLREGCLKMFKYL